MRHSRIALLPGGVASYDGIAQGITPPLAAS